MVGLRLGLWIDRVRESWVKELGRWVCWWLSGGCEPVAVVRQAEGEWEKELSGCVCWWLSGGSELGAVDIEDEGVLGQGVG